MKHFVVLKWKTWQDVVMTIGVTVAGGIAAAVVWTLAREILAAYGGE